MSRYDAYAPQSPVLSTQKGWIISALTGSLVVHAGLFLWLHWQKVEIFGVEPPPPPAEILQRIRLIDQPNKKPEELKAIIPDRKISTKKELLIPTETPNLEEIKVGPQHKPLDINTFAKEKPTVEMAALTAPKINDDALLPKLPDEAFTGSKTGPKVMARPMSDPGPDGAGTSKAIQVAGQDVETILSGLTAGKGNSNRLSVPGNMTFDYDSAVVSNDEELEKIAEVFRKFLGDDLKKVVFIIEGHTDPTGTAEYNMKLSERRAEAVKAWYVTHLGLDPAKVQTKGYGATRPLEGVPLVGTVEELAGHRRTEIRVPNPHLK